MKKTFIMIIQRLLNQNNNLVLSYFIIPSHWWFISMITVHSLLFLLFCLCCSWSPPPPPLYTPVSHHRSHTPSVSFLFPFTAVFVCRTSLWLPGRLSPRLSSSNCCRSWLHTTFFSWSVRERGSVINGKKNPKHINKPIVQTILYHWKWLQGAKQDFFSIFFRNQHQPHGYFWHDVSRNNKFCNTNVFF